MKFEELIRRQAEKVFGSKVKADLWLIRPLAEFDDVAAFELARDEA